MPVRGRFWPPGVAGLEAVLTIKGELNCIGLLLAPNDPAGNKRDCSGGDGERTLDFPVPAPGDGFRRRQVLDLLITAETVRLYSVFERQSRAA